MSVPKHLRADILEKEKHSVDSGPGFSTIQGEKHHSLFKDRTITWTPVTECIQSEASKLVKGEIWIVFGFSEE